MSSLVRLVRSWTFTFQRTGKQAAPEALLSSDLPLKSTLSRQSSSSTGARSQDARYAWILRKTGPVRPASGAISAGRRPTEDVTTSVEATKAAMAIAVTTSPETTSTAVTTTAASMKATVTAVAADGRLTSRSGPKAVGAGSAARSAASDGAPNRADSTKKLGRGANPARVPVVLYPQGV